MNEKYAIFDISIAASNNLLYLPRELYKNFIVLMLQIRFEKWPWGGIRVKVPRPVIARFDEVRSDLSFIIHYNPFRNANFKWSRCRLERTFSQHNE